MVYRVYFVFVELARLFLMKLGEYDRHQFFQWFALHYSVLTMKRIKPIECSPLELMRSTLFIPNKSAPLFYINHSYSFNLL